MNDTNNITLVLKNLQIGYTAGKPVFSEINLELKPGSFTGLIGNNGIGKSTLLKTICGLIPPLSGEVLIGTKKIQHCPQQELARLISLVLTDKIEGFNLTVFDVVSTGRYPYTGYFGELSDKDIQLTQHYITQCGIEHIQHKSISEISDGERQKALIARALAQQTPVMLLDEPTAFLDYASKKNSTQLLKDMAHRENKIILLSSHDLDILLRYADQALLIEENNTCTLESPENMRAKFYL